MNAPNDSVRGPAATSEVTGMLGATGYKGQQRPKVVPKPAPRKAKAAAAQQQDQGQHHGQDQSAGDGVDYLA
jgi:hypothetical protein